jgi:hypothetical protein
MPQQIDDVLAAAGWPDMVHQPPHYRQGKVECIDAIEAALGEEGFRAYCRGQVIKYCWRSEHKGNPTQDLAKAQWYLDRLQRGQG